MKFVFIRHGLSESNKNRIISGSKDVPLSDEGKAQLIELRENIFYPKTDYNVVTSLSRTRQTFEILFPNEKIDKVEHRLSEISFGEYEGMSFDDINLDNYFFKLYHNEDVCGNETMEELYCRVEESLVDLILELRQKNLKSAKIVAHSTVIRAVAVKSLKDDYETFKKVKPKNGRGFIIDIDVDNSNRLVFKSCESL